ncbi:MAG: methionyl-tRNA formyltransferase [Acidimicrobiaceae bacterium]|jgi:methionyl-tRNA formyltransferase|nr:methionyl-tRNA formyltransferase [Acidimicrobiaceae bacterium]
MTRIAFLGTPEAAVPTLRALAADGHDIAIAVTQPDKKRGRGSALVPSPVKQAAEELGIPVAHQVDAVLEDGVDAELGVVVAFGKLIKPHVLDRLPMVNVHFSLLPRWRGAAPVERAILAGDAETGVCIMALDEGLDTGPVYTCESTPIGVEETADDLRSRLVEIGTGLLVDRLRTGLGEPSEQQGEPTYAAKLEPEEFCIDWSKPAAEIHRLVRLGRAWTTFRGRRLRILRATLDLDAAGHRIGDLVVTEVQPEGKGPMAANAWANGARPGPDERFGD